MITNKKEESDKVGRSIQEMQGAMQKAAVEAAKAAAAGDGDARRSLLMLRLLLLLRPLLAAAAGGEQTSAAAIGRRQGRKLLLLLLPLLRLLLLLLGGDAGKRRGLLAQHGFANEVQQGVVHQRRAVGAAGAAGRGGGGQGERCVCCGTGAGNALCQPPTGGCAIHRQAFQGTGPSPPHCSRDITALHAQQSSQHC